ncbi:SLC13 family permease [Pelagibacterium lentulum]|uniref:Sodium:sulfate symporter n=1 Tax=Pelagibacterium lentulum TaxID=2029865 RepID=A0A916W2V5_9HYPH|nr:SLC13 family permease [Pelagibacterium lentulum]GGA62236.1 sodium:sulfate symporter [Pelagibacterium lentulum]
MNSDLGFVLMLLGAAIVMFIVGRPRMDGVALLVIVILPLSGIVSIEETLTGFADPNIILIAALFVIGEGLVRTGVAQRMGDWLAATAGQSEARMIVLLMIIVAGVGSVMSSTGVVAIFIPIVLRIAARSGTNPGRLMMPLSIAALISGMMTLVATAPNLVVHGELERRGFEGFGFFSFTAFGIPMLVLAVVYMLFARRFLTSEKAADVPNGPQFSTWIDQYALAGREHRLQIRPGSPMIGQSLGELDLRSSEGLTILAIERRQRLGRQLVQPRADKRLASGDILLIDYFGPQGDVGDIVRRFGLRDLPLSGAYYTDYAQEIGMAEVMVPAGSDLIGKSLVESQFRTHHDLSVIGVKRGRDAISDSLGHVELALGDTLLVVGPWKAVTRLQGDFNHLIVLDLPRESTEVLPAPDRAPFALAALALMIVMMVTGIVPNLTAALIACLMMGLFGCVDFKSAYRAIHWQSLVLIVGMLPFSIALQRTGGVDIAAQALLDTAGAAGPHLILASIFVVTAGLGLFVSNTATAVLMAPVALGVADALGASPYPFAMTVALAASAAFMTPVSSPVNTLVVGPGRYRFIDFVKIGTPLALIALCVCVVMVPIILPF